MWVTASEIVSSAVRDFLRSWRSLALTDIAYKVVAFALLTPATALLLRVDAIRRRRPVVADADIARFFLTTPVGIVTLVVGGALLARHHRSGDGVPDGDRARRGERRAH